LHGKDVVHGDLKGGNVLLTNDHVTVKLCDLGNSRLLEHEQSLLSLKSAINGTLAWMAPECQESKTGKKSDIWSLGCLVVEMLTGENPWGKKLEGVNPVMELQRLLQDKQHPEAPPDTSKECREFLNKCF
jgi:serine/threonine protein kinase